MNEQDCRAVENMALTGMELEGLYACFPKFPREEIERIYMESKIRTDEDPADTLMNIPVRRSRHSGKQSTVNPE